MKVSWKIFHGQDKTRIRRINDAAIHQWIDTPLDI